MLNQPMSSPMMKTMFGRCPAAAGAGVGCCACAGVISPTAESAEAATSELPLSSRSRRFIPPPDCGAVSWDSSGGCLLLMNVLLPLLCNWLCSLDASEVDVACGGAGPGAAPYPVARYSVGGRPVVGRPHHPQASELLARVPLTLLELFHDLIQVVTRRILKGGKLLVGFQLLQPQDLSDGQQVPVVYVTRDRPGERAAEPETRLFLIAPRHLEWIALEVYHAGCELGLDSRGEEARRGFGRDREIHLPILVAHRRRV